MSVNKKDKNIQLKHPSFKNPITQKAPLKTIPYDLFRHLFKSAKKSIHEIRRTHGLSWKGVMGVAFRSLEVDLLEIENLKLSDPRSYQTKVRDLKSRYTSYWTAHEQYCSKPDAFKWWLRDKSFKGSASRQNTKLGGIVKRGPVEVVEHASGGSIADGSHNSSKSLARDPKKVINRKAAKEAIKLFHKINESKSVNKRVSRTERKFEDPFVDPDLIKPYK